MKNFRLIKPEYPIVQHKGIFRRQLSLFEGVALIVGATIGAGVLGIPYVVAKVGMTVGIVYIITLGLLNIGLNLLIGELLAKTKGEYQVVGLTKKYLGRWAGVAMTILYYVMTLGVLTVYIIGEGESLAELFKGNPFWWSTLFFLCGSAFIYFGLRSTKTVDFILNAGILFVIILIAWFSAPHISMEHLNYNNFAYLFLPYGVILLAFNGIGAVPEAHAVLKNRDNTFKKTIIIAGFINIFLYILFAFSVVGVTGIETTEIATIGLGNVVGSYMFVFGNVFAVLAMATSFLVIGLSLKDSLRWDYKVSNSISALITCVMPFIIFVLGLRGFIYVLNIVGGVFVSLSIILLVLVYWYAHCKGELKKSKYYIHHTMLLVALLLIVATLGTVYSVMKLF